jgi:large subunit ribosomal protein L22
MITKAVIKKVRVSPRKTRVVANFIRGKKIDEALRILKFEPKKASEVLAKALKSAVANAEENKKFRDTERLYISELKIDEGPAYKRFTPRAYGRASLIKRKTSHITVILSEMEEN